MPLSGTDIVREMNSGVPVMKAGLSIWSPFENNNYVNKGNDLRNMWTVNGSDIQILSNPLKPWPTLKVSEK